MATRSSKGVASILKVTADLSSRAWMVISGSIFLSDLTHLSSLFPPVDAMTTPTLFVVLLDMIGRPPIPMIDRFMCKIMVNWDTGCWLWTARKFPNGYSQFIIKKPTGKWDNTQGHIIAYKLYRGDIPSGLELDHLCRRRHCVNPFHLEAVTSQVNVLRGNGITDQNARKTHCPKGHDYQSRDKSGARRCNTCQRLRDQAKARLKLENRTNSSTV